MTNVKPNDVAVLARLMDQYGWKSLRVTLGSTTVELGEAPSQLPAARPAPSAALSAAPIVDAPVASAPETPASEPRATAPKSSEAVGETGFTVKAPNLGTFYRAPTPGAAPYVEVGQHVEPGDEVCLIEVMKLYTPVPAGVAGFVREVLVTEGAMVEFDQALVIIDPDA